MRITQYALTFVILCMFTQVKIFGQINSCPNSDFEDNSFQNWTGSYTELDDWRSNNNVNQVGQYIETPGFDPNPIARENVHVITNATMTDPYVAGLPTVYPDGGLHSLRIGNYYDFQGNNPQAAQSTVRYQVTVPDADFIYTFHYAVVLEDPNDSHETLIENGEEYIFRPFFNVEMFDELGDTLECSEYFALADPTVLTDYKYVRVDDNPRDNIRTNCGNNCSDVYYREWTTISIPLGDYVGQTLTIEFVVSDCKRSGHFGYAYIDTECSSPKVKDINLCGDEPSVIHAPSGFGSYQWSFNSLPIGGDSASLFVSETGSYDLVATTATDFPCEKPYYNIVVKDTCVFDTLEFCESIQNSATVNGVLLSAYTTDLEAKFNAVIQNWYIDEFSTSPLNPTIERNISNETTLYALMTSNDDGRTVQLHHLFIVNPLPDMGLPKLDSLCVGDDIYEIVGTPSGGIFTGTNITETGNFDPITVGSFPITYTFTDDKGCINDTTKPIVVSTLPVLNIPNVSDICAGDSIQFLATADKSVATYRWYSNETTLSNPSLSNPYASPLTTTHYDLEITDTDGCKDSAGITVTVKPLLVVDAGDDVSICVGFSTQLEASGATSYTWTPAASLDNATIANPVATPAETDTIIDFIVVGTTANSCENQDTVRVTLLFPSSLEITEDTAICDYLTVPLNTNIPLSTYQWTPASVVSDAGIRNPIANPSTTVEIFLDGTDENNCPYRDSLIITVFPKPVLTIPSVNPICTGDSIQFAAVSDKTVDTYRWFTNAVTLSDATISNPYASPLITTTYDLEITDTDECKDSAKVTVTVNPSPVVSAGADDKICLGEMAQLQATGANSYVWTPSTSLNNATIANPQATPSTTTTYIVIGSTLFNCTDSDTVEVIVLDSPNPSISIQYDRDVCIGDEVTFSIASSAHLGTTPIYSWHQVNLDNSDIIISDQEKVTVANFENGTSFYLEVVSNEICVDPSNNTTTSLEVTPLVYLYPDLSVFGPFKVCYGDPAVFSVTDNNHVSTVFTWLDASNTVLQNSGNTSFSIPSVTVQQQIKVAASNWNCSDTVTTSVEPIQVFLNVFADDTILYNGTSTYVYFATNADSLNLKTTPFDGSPQLLVNTNILPVTPLETTIYTGIAFIEECEVIDSVKIRVLPPVSAPYFFSPNGDDKNDIWIVKDLEKWPLTRVVILNRWGMEVTRLGNREHTWDGTNRSGHPLPDGVYYYVIEAGIKDLDDNKIINYSGYVTITK